MAMRILSRAKFLELSPSDRLTFLEAAARAIDEAVAQMKSGEVQIRDDRPRSYYLMLLYVRRRRLAELAQEAGHGELMGSQAKAA